MNIHEEKSREAYNRIAANYSETLDGQYTVPFKEMIVREAALCENDRVLDVACGTGELLGMLNRKCRILGTGVDISDEMIRVARKGYTEFSFEVSGCAPLGFDDGTFDVITVSAAFHHFPDPGYFAREAYRVLKKGGRIYVADPYFPPIIRTLANWIFLPLYNAGDVKVYRAGELKKIFASAGFSGISTEREGKAQLLLAIKT